MKRRPWPLIILALLHVLAPFGNLYLNSLRHDISMLQLWNLWWIYIPKYIVATYVLVPVFAGIMIYICKRWSFYAYLVALAAIFAGSIYGFATDVNYSNFLFLVGVLLVDVVLVAYFMVPNVRQVYLDPRLRWWETASRFRAEFEADVVGYGIGTIGNISEGGLFFKSAYELPDNAKIEIKFAYNNNNYSVEGQVVHHRMVGLHGYGIQFSHSHETAKRLKKLMQELRDDGRELTDRLPGAEDGFLAWLGELIKTGRGLLPKVGGR